MEVTNGQKAIATASIAGVIAILSTWNGCFESPTPGPSPSPSVIVNPAPSTSPSSVVSASPIAGTTQVLDTFERPEWAQASQWKQSMSRTILDGQTTSIVLKSSAPCGLTGIPGISKALPVTTTKPSAPSYPVGTFYDALAPLTSANCADAKYLQLDVTQSITVGDASITIVKKATKAPVTPRVPLHVEANSWNVVQRYCGGGWCQTTPAIETYGKQLSAMLAAHRLSPYKAFPGGGYSWQEYQGAFTLGAVAYIAYGDVPSLTPYPSTGWAYVHDEPTIDLMGSVATKLANWKSRAPGITRMLTTSIRLRDTRPGTATFGKIVDLPPAILADTQIFAPVAEALCVESWKGSGDFYPCADAYKTAGKTLWLYVSNMSHGAEGGSATGAPDVMIDRSAVEEFGFYLAALKYDLSGLLYYNAIEGWQNTTIDLVSSPYQFGGNGDGLLAYPDRPNKQALPSMRLKSLREASQWADVILLAGKAADAKAFMTTTLNWQRDMPAFEALRISALALIP